NPATRVWPAFAALGCLPVACHALALAAAVRRTARPGPLPANQVHGLFSLLGGVTFALIVALALLLQWCWSIEPSVPRDLDKALASLAVLIALAGLPILACGLRIHHGLSAQAATGSLRTAGTGVGLTGILILLVALGLAWPNPVALVLVGVLDFAALTYIAFRYGRPLAHALALPCLTGAYLAAYHLFLGHVNPEQ